MNVCRRSWKRQEIFLARFLEEVKRNYAIAGTIGTRTVYLPRRG
jgi:hypothetical protein